MSAAAQCEVMRQLFTGNSYDVKLDCCGGVGAATTLLEAIMSLSHAILDAHPTWSWSVFPTRLIVASIASVLSVSSLAPAQEAAWDARELRDGHIGQVEGVAFSPNGKWLASADNSGTLIVRTLEGAGQPWRFTGRNFTEVAWSADSRTLVAGGFDSLVYVWRWPEEKAPRLLRYPGQVEVVSVSPSGVILAGGGGDRTIRRWALPHTDELPPLRGHSDDIYAVRMSPDGSLIVSAGRDRTIRVLDAATGRAMRVLRGHGDSVYDLAFSPDGAWLVSGCRDGSVGIWDMESGELRRVLGGPTNSVHGVTVKP